MFVLLQSRFQDAKVKVDTVGIPFEANQDLPSSWRAVDAADS